MADREGLKLESQALGESNSGFLARLGADPLAVGFLGSILVLLGTIQPNSPFTSKIPGSWFFGVPANPLPGNGVLELLSNWVVYVGMSLTIFAWVRLVITIYRGEPITSRRLWAIFWLWVFPLMVAGPLLSRDVYSYAAQGEMVALGFSPYKHGPFVLGHNPFLLAVDPMWGNAPAPYGPVFLSIAALFVRVTGHSVLGTVVLLRLAALAGVVAVGIYAPKIARHLGYSPEAAFALAVLNPLMLYDLASAGHNDAWMMGFMLPGIYYCLVGRNVLGIVLIALGGAVKAPALGALVFVGYNWTTSDEIRAKIRSTATALMIAVVTLVLLGAVTGLGVGWVKSLSTPGAVLSPADPITAVATFVHTVTSFLGVPVSIYLYLSVMRLAGLAASAAFGLVLLLRSNRSRMVRQLGLSLLVLVFFGPVIWPWYLAWAVGVLACSAGEYGAYTLVAVSLLGFPLAFPGGGQSIVAWLVYVSVVVLLALGLAYRQRWLPLSARMQLDETVVRLRWMVEREFGSSGIGYPRN